MTGFAFFPPDFVLVNSSGRPYAGAVARFYEAGTNTPLTVYTTAALSTAHGSSVTADAAGVFPAVFVDPDAGDYKVSFFTSGGSLIRTRDNLPAAYPLTAEQVGAALYPRSASEIAAGVTPTDYTYPPGNVLRYGAVGDNATDNTEAFQNAVAATGAYGGHGIVTVPKGTYRLSALSFVGVLGLTLKGENGGNVGNLSGTSTGGASVLNFVNTTGDSLNFTCTSYNAANIHLEDVAVFANTSGYAISFTPDVGTGKQVSQIYFTRVTVTNAGGTTPTTGNGIRFSANYYVSARELYVWKTGTLYTVGQGIVIDMGGRTSFLGGEFNFDNCSIYGWQTGLSAGNASDAPSANESYANVNLINSELNSNSNGAQFLYGVKVGVVSGCYIEGNLESGLTIANQAQSVTVEKSFFNNSTATAADIRCGVIGSTDSYKQFYNITVRDCLFYNVKVYGIRTVGEGTYNLTQNSLTIDNCRFTLGTTGAKAINSNVTTSAGSQWFISAYDCNTYGFASGDGYVGQFAKLQNCYERNAAGVTLIGHSESVLTLATYASDYQIVPSDPETVVVTNTRAGAKLYAPIVATSKGRKQYIANHADSTQSIEVWNGAGTSSLGTLTAGSVALVWNDGTDEYYTAL